MTHEQMADFLRKSFAKHERMSIKNYEKLAAILDNANFEALQFFANANIRFVSSLSRNRINRILLTA